MIILHQVPRAWGLPSISPFCVKLETYLRMAKLEYKSALANPLKAPRGRVPFVELDGQIIADSSEVIDELKRRFGDTLDAKLSPKQKALAVALQSLVEDRLYFAAGYLRFSDDESWTYVRRVFQQHMPPVIGGVILSQIRKGAIRDFTRQGTGERSRDQIIAIAQEALTALSVFLGDQDYFLGSEPSSVDAMMYGFLIQQIWVPWSSPVKQHALGLKNLVSYCDRMKARYWS